MSSQGKLIDLNTERSKRIHDAHDKRLNDMRNAFEQALPLASGKPKKKKDRNKPKKR
ncbi:hypothetical protein [Azomonas macrocytogenes]|uniref:Uncharacterized protein n=1 Tax=Azomonas macrocytogenes TaxID=69962 RepID=A0A839SZZ5_AZOMA|nr:hypothetical protein [Azomonas macrocytogenes]MBB3102289.1 hypothetical protein [Azomonas macrocytogenes]